MIELNGIDICDKVKLPDKVPWLLPQVLLGELLLSCLEVS